MNSNNSNSVEWCDAVPHQGIMFQYEYIIITTNISSNTRRGMSLNGKMNYDSSINNMNNVSIRTARSVQSFKSY